MMAHCPRGALFFLPEKMGDERAKDHFANTAALICIAHDAREVVLVLEAWIKVAAPGETRDPDELPSEALDRREVVVLSGEACGRKRQKFLPILRTDAGGFFGFGESDLPEFENIRGRFPVRRPTSSQRPTGSASTSPVAAAWLNRGCSPAEEPIGGVADRRCSTVRVQGEGFDSLRLGVAEECQEVGEVHRMFLVEVLGVSQHVANTGGRAGILKLGWLGGGGAGERRCY